MSSNMTDITEQIQFGGFSYWRDKNASHGPGWSSTDPNLMCPDSCHLARALTEVESLRAERDRYRDALAKVQAEVKWTDGTMFYCQACEQEDNHAPDCVWLPTQGDQT